MIIQISFTYPSCSAAVNRLKGMKMSQYRNTGCDAQGSIEIGMNSSVKSNNTVLFPEEKCIARKGRLPKYPILHSTERGCLIYVTMYT